MEEKWSDRVAYSRRSDQIVERAVRMVGSELNRTRRKRGKKEKKNERRVVFSPVFFPRQFFDRAF